LPIRRAGSVRDLLTVVLAPLQLRDQDDDPQIIVSEADLPTYLVDGWEFVSVLPSKNILIRK